MFQLPIAAYELALVEYFRHGDDLVLSEARGIAHVLILAYFVEIEEVGLWYLELGLDFEESL